MPTLVEIGPSNASQGQHRRKDATEQIKNMTLAGIRTKVPGFSSADSITTKPWVPVDLGSTPSECQIFFICSVASFLLCCPCEALEGPISTRVGII